MERLTPKAATISYHRASPWIGSGGGATILKDARFLHHGMSACDWVDKGVQSTPQITFVSADRQEVVHQSPTAELIQGFSGGLTMATVSVIL